MTFKEYFSDWNNVERTILIFTFIVTCITAIISIFTSKAALKQASIDLRPWIIIKKVETNIFENNVQPVFFIENIGKLPAYLKIEDEEFIDNILVVNPILNQGLVVIMPNQTLQFAVTFKLDNIVNLVKQDKFKSEVIAKVRIKYGNNKKEIENYFTFIKAKLDNTYLALKIRDHNFNRSLWAFEESDFK